MHFITIRWFYIQIRRKTELAGRIPMKYQTRKGFKKKARMNRAYQGQQACKEEQKHDQMLCLIFASTSGLGLGSPAIFHAMIGSGNCW
jgi:hypothetical protein